MMRLLLPFAPMLFAMGLVATAQTVKPLDVSDGFEGATLSDLWSTERMAPGAFVLEDQVVLAGKQAVAITVRPGNVFEAGRHGNSDSERAELLEARRLIMPRTASYEYSFSMFFPKDFPIVPTRLVIAQWKQYCPEGVTTCDDDSPVLALRYIGGTLSITQDIEHKRNALYEETGEFRGRWIHFRIQARFAPEANGRVKTWIDGKQVVNFTGVTCNRENAATGYLALSRVYFKMGLYRNVMQQPMTVYIDEYRKRELSVDEF
jgi:hypothetical protein